MSYKRLAKELRQEKIIRAAIKLANRDGGWITLTRYRVAEAADCSEPLVNLYFGDMSGLKSAVAAVAVQESILPIIAQSIAANDGYINVNKTPKDLLTRATASLLN